MVSGRRRSTAQPPSGPSHRAPEVLERANLQGIIGGEPWLFGEEYALHVSDKGLTRVLVAHLRVLGRDSKNIAPVRDADGRIRRIDFMFGRSLELNRNRREHLVVEIKRPTVELRRKELSQVEDYARAVAADRQFDTDSTDWDFFLVSNDMDDYVADRSRQPGKPPGLAFELRSGNARVWVKRWNTIIAEARHRLKFVKEHLEYDPGSDEAVNYLQENYPDYVPQVIASPPSNPDQPTVNTAP